MSRDRWPWLPGSATGVGSLPGTDVLEAAKIVFGELTALPHVPELPERGPGSDLLGRGAAVLADLPVELYAGRWRAVRRGGRDLRRSRQVLQRDLDAVYEVAQGYAGPVKIQSAGPWTLAAGVDLAAGGPILRDRGAVRDLAGSLAEGLRVHLADIARRLPVASVVLQLDEPALPSVLGGRVPTESGLHMLPAVEPAQAEAVLALVVGAAGVPVVVHCCAPDVPVPLLHAAGAAAISVDLALLGEQRGTLDRLGEVLDAGVGLFAGAVPTAAAADRPPASARVADTIAGLWRRLGLDVAHLPTQVVVTPACGLAGASLDYARAALSVSVEAGRRLCEYV